MTGWTAPCCASERASISSTSAIHSRCFWRTEDLLSCRALSLLKRCAIPAIATAETEVTIAITYSRSISMARADLFSCQSGVGFDERHAIKTLLAESRETGSSFRSLGYFAASPLHRTTHHPGHQMPPEERHEDQHRQDSQRGARSERSPLTSERADELVDGHLDRSVLRGVDHHCSGDELVPGADEHEEARRGHARAAQGQDHRGEGAQA